MGISEIARKRRWESESVRPLISVAFRSPFLNLKNAPCPRLTCVKNIYVQGDHGAPPGGEEEEEEEAALNCASLIRP